MISNEIWSTEKFKNCQMITTNNSSFQGITVREGDSNLITRLESPKLGKMEMIREFSKDGMVLVSTKI